MVPSTISCLTLPEFLATKRIVSPCLTAMLEEWKRMSSVMSTVTVRVTLEATPGLPMASSPWPPAWLPDAMADMARKIPGIAVKRLRNFMKYLLTYFPQLPTPTGVQPGVWFGCASQYSLDDIAH